MFTANIALKTKKRLKKTKRKLIFSKFPRQARTKDKKKISMEEWEKSEWGI